MGTPVATPAVVDQHHEGEENTMGIGTSLFLLAAGAILTYAVDVETDGFNLDTVGIILMIVGAIGVLLSLIFWSSWGGFHRRDVVVDGGARRRTVVDEDL
jgi:hypothetical protein